jgi:hypothetical protein
MSSILYNVGSNDRLMSPTEAAYLAGFIDGEGCLTIGRASRKENRAGYRYIALLTVSNTDLRALHRITDLCGNGKIQLQDKRSSAEHKTLYRVIWSSNQMRHILPQIRPYLLIKGPQADIVMEYLAMTKAGRNTTPEYWRRCEELRAEVRTLNKRGLVNTAPEVIALREDLRCRQSRAVQ